MSIPSIGNALLGVYYPATQSSGGKRDAAAGTPQSPAVLESDTVILSPEAQAMASFNAKGITVVAIHSRGLSSGQQPVQPSSVVDGPVSKANFETMAASFGDTTSQADQDFATMDTNGNGSISNAEMLDAMSATSHGNEPLSQNLRQMRYRGAGRGVLGSSW
jgi:hypothetical protein